MLNKCQEVLKKVRSFAVVKNYKEAIKVLNDNSNLIFIDANYCNVSQGLYAIYLEEIKKNS